MVAERGSVAKSSSTATSVAITQPQNLPPPVRDEFAIHSSDEESSSKIKNYKIPKVKRIDSEDVLLLHDDSANSIFKDRSNPFKKIEHKDSLTVIIDNNKANANSQRLKSMIVVPPQSLQNHSNPNRGDFGKNNSNHHRNRNRNFRPNRAPYNRAATSFNQLPNGLNSNFVASVAPSTQEFKCPGHSCAHVCTSAQSVASINDNNKITLDIADLKRLLESKDSSVPAPKRKKLSSGQHKRLKRAAENKLKRELGFEKWWELQRAQELEKFELLKKQ